MVLHGRLNLCNGNPMFRIWIVGTKRLLGVEQISEIHITMPPELIALAANDQEVFADFTVEPLTSYKPGVMQMVRITSASKIVVTKDGRILAMMRALKGPSKPVQPNTTRAYGTAGAG